MWICSKCDNDVFRTRGRDYECQRCGLIMHGLIRFGYDREELWLKNKMICKVCDYDKFEEDKEEGCYYCKQCASRGDDLFPDELSDDEVVGKLPDIYRPAVPSRRQPMESPPLSQPPQETKDDNICKENKLCFPERGETNISKLKVKRRKRFYSCSDYSVMLSRKCRNWYTYVEMRKKKKQKPNNFVQKGPMESLLLSQPEETKKVSGRLQDILRRSASYKEAFLRASQSQLKDMSNEESP